MTVQTQSIYEYILANLQDGVFPDDLCLDRDYLQHDPSNPDGSADGISIFHMPQKKVTRHVRKEILQAISKSSPDRYVICDRILGSGLRGVRIISLLDSMDEFLKSIPAEEFDDTEYKALAAHLICETQDTEFVKLGLAMLKNRNLPMDDLETVIDTLSLNSEFTAFTIPLIKNRPNGNQIVFELLKKVRGWGRIQCIRNIDADTDEIREYLLHHGTEEIVRPEYTAVECFRKIDGVNLLKEDISYETYEGLSSLMDIMMNEQIVLGIRALDDAPEVLADFLKQAETHASSARDFSVILHIKSNLENVEAFAEDVETCNELLKSDSCINAASEAAEQGTYPLLTSACELDYKPALLANMQNDFGSCYANCRYLMPDPAYKDQVIELFRQNLPLSEMKQMPTIEPGGDGAFPNNDILDHLVQQLRPYVLEGTDLVECALCSPTIRSRNLAVRVLKSWVSERETPLNELSPEMFELLTRIEKSECYSPMKSAMFSLLTHKTHFPPNEI